MVPKALPGGRRHACEGHRKGFRVEGSSIQLFWRLIIRAPVGRGAACAAVRLHTCRDQVKGVWQRAESDPI